MSLNKLRIGRVFICLFILVFISCSINCVFAVDDLAFNDTYCSDLDSVNGDYSGFLSEGDFNYLY